MTLLIDALPKEILYYHLIPLLEPDDVISLVRAGVIEATETVYHQVFRDHMQISDFSRSEFDKRCGAKLYVFGSTENDRIGVLDSSTDCYFETARSKSGQEFRRMWKPLGVDSTDPIVRVFPGSASLMVLTASGELYFSGLRPSEMDSKPQTLLHDKNAKSLCQMTRFNTTRKMPGSIDTAVNDDDIMFMASMQLDSAKLNRYEAYFGDTTRIRRFVDAGGEDDSLNALDSDGLIWALDWYGYEGGVALLGLDDDDQLIKNPVLEVRSYSCFIKGKGLAYICNSSYTKELPVRQTRMAIVPGTSQGILDWVYTLRYMLYIDRDGQAHLVDAQHMQRGNENYVNDLAEANAMGRFVQVSGSKERFSLLLEDGGVVLVTPLNSIFAESTIIKVQRLGGLQGLDIASVSVGDTHGLALAKDGAVYSWGEEQKMNGCLGLGKLRKALKIKGVKRRQSRLVCKRPVKIDLPGKAYGVYAGKDYSAVLVYEADK